MTSSEGLICHKAIQMDDCVASICVCGARIIAAGKNGALARYRYLKCNGGKIKGYI